jgi:hypothetical protein
MARRGRSPEPTIRHQLETQRSACVACGGPLWVAYHKTRTISTLQDVAGLTLAVRRCQDPACLLYHQPYRPEEEGRWALPRSTFGLDVIALVGRLRYAAHRSVPEIHRHLVERGVRIAERTVTHLVYRYEELLAVHLADQTRRTARVQAQGRVILALDGLQPDVGHEVLWVLRDCLSGEVLLARSLLSSTGDDLAALLREVISALPVPVAGVISDGQHPIRDAVATVLPGVPHQLCQFHYLREAARPLFEADRHAKKELKKQVRGVRPIERAVEGRTDEEAEVVRGYCLAVRSALTDDGRPPLCAAGLRLHDRLSLIHASVVRIVAKGGPDTRCAAWSVCLGAAWRPPRTPGPRSAPSTHRSIARPISWPTMTCGRAPRSPQTTTLWSRR